MNDLLTSPEVSRLLGVSIRTVHRKAETGVLPPAQKLPGPNGAFLFWRKDVDALLAEALTQHAAPGEQATKQAP